MKIVAGAMLVAAAPAPLAGINLAGGEFNSARKPGVYAKDYIYPDAKVARPFLKAGIRVVRIPVLWERVQPRPNKPLSQTEMKRIDNVFDQLSGARLIIFDIHNYGRWNGTRLDQIAGGSAMLADLWKRLADHYRDRPKVAFGIMNEPNGLSPQTWRKMVDESVAAIRSTGARNLVLVPGSNWTGAHSWTAGRAASNASAFADFRDPGDNFVYDLHQYLDPGNAGVKTECVDEKEAVSRLASATAWLRGVHARAFLGEFGAAGNPQCLRSLQAMLTYLDRHREAWMGWAYWAGGGWWGHYPYSAQPGPDGRPGPQMSVLIRFSAGGAGQ